MNTYTPENKKKTPKQIDYALDLARKITRELKERGHVTPTSAMLALGGYTIDQLKAILNDVVNNNHFKAEGVGEFFGPRPAYTPNRPPAPRVETPEEIAARQARMAEEKARQIEIARATMAAREQRDAEKKAAVEAAKAKPAPAPRRPRLTRSYDELEDQGYGHMTDSGFMWYNEADKKKFLK